ncbi:hypothetical protein NLJ89_g6294 [Agrocybe chaxingu]|uniref:Uncharacterized protein n=1 Tax=Agrocybe chaxingu TaxID=84603 RepID=A0A9W8MSU3_9AGAR|nr:hypothetical protein NLJ89_g6294 [Agrocybe chaxingu]
MNRSTVFLTQPTPLSYFKVDQIYPTYRFQFGDYHFTSPNQHSLPPAIPEYAQLPVNPPVPLLRQRLWEVHDRPYLAFMLRSPLAGRAMHQFTIPLNITEGSSGWHLPWDTAKAWKRFEHSLRAVAHQLVSYLKLRHPQINHTWIEPSKPSSYGYFGPHPSEEQARCGIKDSIDGFIVYAAYLSFLICLGRFVGTSRSAPEFFKAAKIEDQDLIVSLLDSGIGRYDANCARVGVFVDARQCPWINVVPFMVKADVPVWLYWGRPPFSVPSNSWISAFAPAEPNSSSAPPISSEGRASSQEVCTDFPEVERHSGQRQGETWEQFQCRRDDMNKAKAEKPEERDARLNRERQNANHPQPGKHGAKVYHWEDVDGFRIRKLLTRYDVTVQWDNWSNSQRVYDSYSNVWDCCSDWGEDREDSDDEDGEYLVIYPRSPAGRRSPAPLPTVDDSSHPPTSSCPSPSPCLAVAVQQVGQAPHPPSEATTQPPSLLHALGQHEESMNVDGPCDLSPKDVPSLNTVPAVTVSAPPAIVSALPAIVPAPLAIVPAPLSIEDLICYQYGYSLRETPYQGLPASFSDVDHPFHHWTTVCRALGGQQLSSMQQNQLPIQDFAIALYSSQRPFHEVPGKYWDLSPWNPTAIYRRESQLCIDIQKFEGEHLCLLLPRGGLDFARNSWVVAVSPMIALECIRRQLCPEPADLALYLVANGTPFLTLRPQPLSPSNPAPPQSSSVCSTAPSIQPLLGSRDKKYKFTIADFNSYESLRQSFLAAMPNARRALSFGGIIARLAKDNLDASSILNGPSDAALAGKQAIFKSSEYAWVDDTLSEAELDLICGTYLIPSSKGAALVSWFPRPNAWASSGLDVHQWTVECEDWFIRRRKEITEDKAQPKNSNTWRRDLRFTQSAPELIRKMNAASLGLLQSTFADALLFAPPSRIQ